MSNQIEINSAKIESLRRRQFGGPNPNPGGREKDIMRPTLYEAISKGDNVGDLIHAMEQACTQMQLPLSVIVMQLSPAGNSLLHEAVALGHNELTATMASHFPDLISMKNILGDTALHVAAKKGSLAIVQLVIAASEEHFPLQEKCVRDSTTVGEASLVKMKNEYGNTALHEAVINVKADVVEFLVNKDVETWYWQNDEGKSPLYLAVQSGDLRIVKILLDAPVSDVVHKLQGHSPVRAAIMQERLDVLKEVRKRRPELFQLKDIKRRNPLHVAAYLGYLAGVDFLLSEASTKYFALEHDEDGQLPIHIPCKVLPEYHPFSAFKLMNKLLRQWPDPSELLDKHGRNILHIAAMNGRTGIVKWILRTPELGVLINQRDKDGNTAIHLATFHWYPFVLYYLARDKRAKVNLVNKQCITASDFVAERMLGGFPRPLRKVYTQAVLWVAGTRRSDDLVITKSWDDIERATDPPNREVLKDQLNSGLIMATLVATMTFAAGVAKPDNPDTATRMNKEMFKVFVISNTIALYSSVLSIVMFLWAQLGDAYTALNALQTGNIPLCLSILSMSLAFLAGTHVALGNLFSLATTNFILALIFISIITMLFIDATCPCLAAIPLVMSIWTFFTGSDVPPSKDLLVDNPLSLKKQPPKNTTV